MQQKHSNISLLINNPAKFLPAIFALWLLAYVVGVSVFHNSLQVEIFISRVFLILLSVWGIYFFSTQTKILFNEYTSPLSLAVFRVVFYGFVSIGFSAPLYLAGYLNVEFPWADIPVSQRVPLPYMSWYVMNVPANALLVSVVIKVIAVSAFCCMLGFRTRFFAFTFLLATFYINGFPNFFGKVNHNHYIIWFAAILCFSPCSDALSIDSWLRKRKSNGQAATISLRENYYNIPLQLIALLIGIIYFFPGFHKVWNSGLHWAFSDNLKNQIFLKALEAGQSKPAFYKPSLDIILQAGGLFTIAFELSFIFLIVSKKHRWTAIAGGVVFHVFSYLFLQINFFYLLACYVLFLDWEKIFQWLGVKFQLPDTSAAATHNRSMPVIFVGAILIGLNVTAGIFKINSWPISCFPRFESVVNSETSELKYVLRNKNELDKNILRSKFTGTVARQWEYQLLNDKDKADSAAFQNDGQNIVERVKEAYPAIQSGDTIDVYVKHLTIEENEWKATGVDSLIFSSVKN